MRRLPSQQLEDFPEQRDPQCGVQRLMVLYSAEELHAAREEVQSFWVRLLSRHCRLHQTLVVDVSAFLQAHTLHGVVPTSFELLLPKLLQDGSVVSVSQVNSWHSSSHSGQTQPTGLSHTLSGWMSSFFETSLPPEDNASARIMSTSLLHASEKDIVAFTRTLPEKSRIHFIPSTYAKSSVEQHIKSSSKQHSSGLLLTLQWDDILLLLIFMHKNGTAVISHDMTIIKFLAPKNYDLISTKSEQSILSRISVMTGLQLSQPPSISKERTISSSDTFMLHLSKSINKLRSRVEALEGQMKSCRSQAVKYKSGKDMYMAKLLLSKVKNIQKQRDSTACALMQLEIQEQSLEECETHKIIISSYHLATRALKQARMVTTDVTERRNVLQADGSMVEEEVVVGVTTKELTVDDVEEAMNAFEEEVEITNEIGQILSDGSTINSSDDDMAELELQLESLELCLDDTASMPATKVEMKTDNKITLPNAPSHDVNKSRDTPQHPRTAQQI